MIKSSFSPKNDTTFRVPALDDNDDDVNENSNNKINNDNNAYIHTNTHTPLHTHIHTSAVKRWAGKLLLNKSMQMK